jgi:hypothetical protein
MLTLVPHPFPYRCNGFAVALQVSMDPSQQKWRRRTIETIRHNVDVTWDSYLLLIEQLQGLAMIEWLTRYCMTQWSGDIVEGHVPSSYHNSVD